jgi:hypothetical protein
MRASADQSPHLRPRPEPDWVVPEDPGWEPPPDEAEWDAHMAEVMDSPPWDPETDDDDMEGWIAGLPDDIRAWWLAPEPGKDQREVFPAGYWHHDDEVPAGAGFAAGGTWDRLPPGPTLARLVAEEVSKGNDQLGESELIGVLCAWHRIAAWAAAGEASTVAALAARRHEQAREPGKEYLADHVADELAAALTLTGRSAAVLLDQAAALARLPQVAAALQTGVIDWRRAMVFTNELCGVTDEDAARAIADQILPAAGRLTTAQLSRALRRAVVNFDPDAARTRKEHAARDARVELFAEGSGNAGLAGRELPEDGVLTADRRLTAMARWLRDHGATGSLQQLRAAAYLALLNGRPVADLAPEPGRDGPSVDADSPLARAAAPAVSGAVNLILPLSALAGLTDRAGEAAGYGPLDATSCRSLAARLADSAATRWCLTVVADDGSEVLAHACAARGPRGPGPPPAGPGALAWATELVRHLEWLERGTCTHRRQEARYRPSARLAHLIKTRQPRCAFPGCGRPATDADLDHTIPYHRGGRTCECGLAPLSRHHHHTKQAPGWQLDQPEPGVMIWRTPSGRTYRTRQEPYPV